MLIFGLRHRTFLTSRMDALCGHCAGWHSHLVGVIKTKLAFFLIPLIPVGSERVVICTSCKHKTVGSDADRFVALYTPKN